MQPTCPSSYESYRLVAVCSAYSTPDLTVFEPDVAAQHITPSFDAVRMGGPRVPFVRGSAGRLSSFVPAKPTASSAQRSLPQASEFGNRGEGKKALTMRCPPVLNWS